jgi:nucleoside-diphosphate-sugar epimerase
VAILVTGAAGFVALNFLEALLGAGRAAIAFDRQPIPPAARARFARLPGRLVEVTGDIRSAANLDRAFAAGPIEAVMHAAVITAGEARERAEPETIIDVNLGGAITVLRAMQRHGVTRLVAPSSGAVYGAPDPALPVLDEETTPPRPLALYGITKLAAEQALLRLGGLEGLSVACPRLGTVYGPWEWATGLRDTLSPMWQALRAAEAGEEALLSPPHRCDYVYVRDVAAGLVALLDESAATGVFNLGSGTASGADEWCAVVAARVPGFRWRIAAPGEVANVITRMPRDRAPMSLARIFGATGWVPRFADMASAADDYLAWRRDTPAAP